MFNTGRFRTSTWLYPSFILAMVRSHRPPKQDDSEDPSLLSCMLRVLSRRSLARLAPGSALLWT